MYLADRRPYYAILELNPILSVDPKNATALSLIAGAYLNIRQPAKAIEAYRKVAALAPDDPQSHYLLGVGLLATGENAEARKELETAASHPQATVDYLAKLVELDLAEQKTDAALARVQRQVAANPTSGRLQYLLGAVYAARADRVAAEAAYRESIRIDPRFDDAKVALGELYANGGNLDRGIAQLDIVLKADPKNAKAATMRGIYYQQKGDIDKARQSYEQALSADPRYYTAANNLAWLLSERFDDNAGALGLSEMASRESPSDPHIADTFGWILYKAGQYKRALVVLQAAEARLPDNPSVQYHLGMTAQRAGDGVLAREALTRAANAREDSPDRHEARKALGRMK